MQQDKYDLEVAELAEQAAGESIEIVPDPGDGVASSSSLISPQIEIKIPLLIKLANTTPLPQ